MQQSNGSVVTRSCDCTHYQQWRVHRKAYEVDLIPIEAHRFDTNATIGITYKHTSSWSRDQCFPVLVKFFICAGSSIMPSSVIAKQVPNHERNCEQPTINCTHVTPRHATATETRVHLRQHCTSCRRGCKSINATQSTSCHLHTPAVQAVAAADGVRRRATLGGAATATANVACQPACPRWQLLSQQRCSPPGHCADASDAKASTMKTAAARVVSDEISGLSSTEYGWLTEVLGSHS